MTQHPQVDPLAPLPYHRRHDLLALANHLRARTGHDAHLLLANELYFAAHEPTTFKLRLYEPLLPLALSTALLAEQLLFGALYIRDGTVIVKPPAADNNNLTALDDVAREVYEQLHGWQHVTSVQEWLEILSEHSYEWVLRRLTRQRLLTATTRRRLLSGEVVVHEPTDSAIVGAGVVRVAGQLSRQDNLWPEDAVLAGLMDAAGLREALLAEALPDKQGVIKVRLDKLPTRELPSDLDELLKALRSSADKVVQSGLA
jgi:hypothetical protein